MVSHNLQSSRGHRVSTPSPESVVAMSVWVLYVGLKDIVPYLKGKMNGTNGKGKVSIADVNRNVLDCINRLCKVEEKQDKAEDKQAALDKEIGLLKNALIGYDGHSGLLDDMRELSKRCYLLEDRVTQIQQRHRN